MPCITSRGEEGIESLVRSEVCGGRSGGSGTDAGMEALQQTAIKRIGAAMVWWNLCF